MTNAACSKRPKKYHRSGGHADRVIEALARHGYSDGAIAGVLSDLSPEALSLLACLPRLTDVEVDDQREPGAGLAWTSEAVRYHRRHVLGMRSRVKRHLSLIHWWARGHRRINDSVKM